MNLKWNLDLHRWEAEFGTDFRTEQPLVKAAGFKTDGPPTWVWYSIKAAPLTKLRETKGPSVILTISSEARAEYIRLKELEDRNAATKALLSEHTKTLKKKLNNDKKEKTAQSISASYFDVEKGVWVDPPPPPPCPTNQPAPPAFVRPLPPPERCIICQDPLYSYEYDVVLACLWCQKSVLDNATEVC